MLALTHPKCQTLAKVVKKVDDFFTRVLISKMVWQLAAFALSLS